MGGPSRFGLSMRGYYRHTKIIANVGPATESRERLASLIGAGLDVMRLNMAHGSGDWVTSLVKRIREPVLLAFSTAPDPDPVLVGEKHTVVCPLTTRTVRARAGGR